MKDYQFNPQSTGSFNVTLQAGSLDGAFFESLFARKEPDKVLRLDGNGQVIAYIHFEYIGAMTPPVAQWYYFNILDRAVWKYALLTGLQLEDAIRELNWEYRNEPYITIKVLVNKEGLPS